MKLFRLTLAIFFISLFINCAKEKDDSKDKFTVAGLLASITVNDPTQTASIIGTVHMIGEVQGAKVELYKIPANLLCSPEGVSTETPIAVTTTNEFGYYSLSVSLGNLSQNGCLLATPQEISTHQNSFTSEKEKWQNSQRGEIAKYLASLIRFDVKSISTKPTLHTSSYLAKSAGTVSTNASTEYTVENICSIAGTNYSGLLPHPNTITNGSSREKYISCLDGVATEYVCKTGSYNVMLGTCTQSIGAYSSVVEKFSSTEVSESSGILTAGGKTFDLVKDDTSCNSKANGLTETNFCSVAGICYNNQLYTRNCPSVGGIPLQYDQATASCTYPVNTNCQERFTSRETAIFIGNINTVSTMAQLQYWVDTFAQTDSSFSSALRSIGIRAGLSEAFCASLISRANASVNSLLGSFVGLDNTASNAMKNVFRAVLAELTKQMGGDMDKALALLREDMSDGSLDGKTASGKTVVANLGNGKTLTLDGGAYSGLVAKARTSNLITVAEANLFSRNAIKYNVLVNVSGLTGTGLTLQLNGGNDLLISRNGISQFSITLAQGSSYSVTIKNNSSLDSCSINSSSGGTIGSANVSLTVNCVISVARPSFNPPEGTYKSDQLVTLSTTTAGATIYYTLDGTDPTTSSTQYSTPISIAGHTTTKTIKAIAVKTGMVNSGVGSATYTITYDLVAQPTFSPSAGTYNSDQSVTLSTTTAGATIYYTLDGTDPTTSSTQYSTAISIAGHANTKTIKAIAIKAGMVNSSVVSANYTITYDSVAQPTFSPGAGEYVANQLVTINTSTSGATIYYTTDGSDPTTSSDTYTAPISIGSTNKTIKAIAVKAGMLNSAIASGAYIVAVTEYSIGGTISGLTASGLVLQNNAGDDLTIASGAVTFTFPTKVGGSYAVTVKTQPTGLICILSSGSGTASADVTNVSVSCSSAVVTRNWGTFTDMANGTIKFEGVAGTFGGNTYTAKTLYFAKCTHGQTYNASSNNCTGTGTTVQFCSVETNICNGGSNSGTLNGSGTSGAYSACNSSNLAGRTWRVPTLTEFKLLINCTTITEMPNDFAQCSSFTAPATITNLFPNTQNDYWTSSGHASFPDYAWRVTFNDSYTSGHNKNVFRHVRCVSGP